MKFALHSFAGKPLRYFLVESEDKSKSQTKAAMAPSHHICVL